MRSILFVLSILLPILSFGDEIKCYNNGKIIYSGEGKEVSYNEGILAFQEMKTDKVIFISADCVVKVKV